MQFGTEDSVYNQYYNLCYEDGIVEEDHSSGHIFKQIQKIAKKFARKPERRVEVYGMNNNRNIELFENWFSRSGFQFFGWYIYKVINKKKAYYCTDGQWRTLKDIEKDNCQRYLFSDREPIGALPVNDDDNLCAVAQWKELGEEAYPVQEDISEESKQKYSLYVYYKGKGSQTYSELLKKKMLRGKIEITEGDSIQLRENIHYRCKGDITLLENRFDRENYRFQGWYMRKKIDDINYWYCDDGVWRTSEDLKNLRAKKLLLEDQACINFAVRQNSKNVIIVYAKWERMTKE